MASVDIMKLAPTLSAKERFKIVVADFHRELEKGKPTLSEAERQAVVRCEKRDVWEEYTRHVGTMQWAGTFWLKDIETEKLRTFACSLMLERALDRLIDAAADDGSEILTSQYEEVRTQVAFLEKLSREFYAYPAAIAKLEQEYLYGMPLFDEKKRVTIAGYYEWADEMFERYNYRIEAICQSEKAQKRLPPIAEHPQKYRAKKPMPDPAIVDGLIADIMGIVDSEMEMLMR